MFLNDSNRHYLKEVKKMNIELFPSVMYNTDLTYEETIKNLERENCHVILTYGNYLLVYKKPSGLKKLLYIQDPNIEYTCTINFNDRKLDAKCTIITKLFNKELFKDSETIYKNILNDKDVERLV